MYKNKNVKLIQMSERRTIYIQICTNRKSVANRHCSGQKTVRTNKKKNLKPDNQRRTRAQPNPNRPRSGATLACVMPLGIYQAMEQKYLQYLY